MEYNNLARLKTVVSKFPKAQVLVIGDLILDEFLWGSVTRISPEAPVPVVWVDRENFMPGGASNVANNIRSLGGQVFLAGVVGQDSRAEVLQALLRKKGVHCDGVLADASRPTTQKTRVIAHHQQVVRIDREIVQPISDAVLRELMAYVRKNLPRMDALVIEDYGKGVIVPGLVREIVRLAKKHGKIITVDPKETHFSYYRGVTTLTPNHYEAGSALGFKIKDDATLERAGRLLLEKLRTDSLIITRGENGMAIFQPNKRPVKIPTIAQEVFDVSGAGDTVIGALTLALASGANILEAAHIANCAAGIVVGKVGVAVTSPDELLGRIRKEMNGSRPAPKVKEAVV